MIRALSNAAYTQQPRARQEGAVVPLGSRSVRTLITDPVRAWRDEVVAKLNDLTALDRGWDGYCAPPVSFENANFALRLLEATCGFDAPAPQIVPGTDGDLQLEWHLNSIDIELHVRAPNDVRAWRATDFTGPDGEETALTIDFTVVVGWIKELSESPSAAASAAA